MWYLKLIFMVVAQEYQNEITPTFTYSKSPKIPEKLLKIIADLLLQIAGKHPVYWHGELERCLVRLWLLQKLYIYMWSYDLDKIVFIDRLRRYTILPRPSSNYFMESVKIWISTFTDRPECLLLTFRDIRLIGINGGGKI